MKVKVMPNICDMVWRYMGLEREWEMDGIQQTEQQDGNLQRK
jgi:hypothetical protein